jgi:hypothetical protein
MFDTKRHLRHGRVSRRAVRHHHQEVLTPTTVEEPTVNASKSEAQPTSQPAPNYAGLGFANRDQFMAWRWEMIRSWAIAHQNEW